MGSTAPKIFNLSSVFNLPTPTLCHACAFLLFFWQWLFLCKCPSTHSFISQLLLPSRYLLKDTNYSYTPPIAHIYSFYFFIILLFSKTKKSILCNMNTILERRCVCVYLFHFELKLYNGFQAILHKAKDVERGS